MLLWGRELIFLGGLEALVTFRRYILFCLCLHLLGILLLLLNSFTRVDALTIRSMDTSGCTLHPGLPGWRSLNTIWRHLLVSLRLLSLSRFLLGRLRFLSFLGSLASIVKLFVAIVGRIKELLKVLRFEFLRWENYLEVATMLCFIVVSFAKFLCSNVVFFFLGNLSFSFDGSALKLKGFLLLENHLFVVAEVKKFDSVGDQVLLDLEIEWRIRRERGRVIDFQYPWLQFVI